MVNSRLQSMLHGFCCPNKENLSQSTILLQWVLSICVNNHIGRCRQVPVFWVLPHLACSTTPPIEGPFGVRAQSSLARTSHLTFNGMLGKLLHKQKGKCCWCDLLFQDGDLVEIDHIPPRSLGGREELSNKFVLHRHCHDQRHAQRVTGTYDEGPIVEELDDAKVSRPVLQTSESGDTPD
jgi:hypothetical protein